MVEPVLGLEVRDKELDLRLDDLVRPTTARALHPLRQAVRVEYLFRNYLQQAEEVLSPANSSASFCRRRTLG